MIPGLGHKGRLCGHRRMDRFSSDGGAVRYGLLRCKRIECPACWSSWARRVVFDLALRIEAYARATDRRPHAVVCSVPPSEVKDRWSWDRVNTSLFRRGYRRLNDHGIEGGIAVFHPYRIKPSWKWAFRRSGVHEDIGMWKVIRERVQEGEDLHNFVELGPHIHGIVFGYPKAHECSDYLVRFNDRDHVPIELEELPDVVALLRYLLSHTGVLAHLKLYRRHRSGGVVVRKQVTHTIREFGALFRFDPSELLPPAELEALRCELALALGMVWSNGELGYPAYCKELGTSDDCLEWVSIYRLPTYLGNEAWLTALSHSQAKFWLAVLEFMARMGRPPDPGEVKPPGDVAVFMEGDDHES